MIWKHRLQSGNGSGEFWLVVQSMLKEVAHGLGGRMLHGLHRSGFFISLCIDPIAVFVVEYSYFCIN